MASLANLQFSCLFNTAIIAKTNPISANKAGLKNTSNEKLSFAMGNKATENKQAIMAIIERVFID
ncbi:MAG: hypothetical protein HYZ54_09125 [Ignavibacteriae bacterium]|nr:hypothetical protein [Ignavibacteriota bacterium]